MAEHSTSTTAAEIAGTLNEFFIEWGIQGLKAEGYGKTIEFTVKGLGVPINAAVAIAEYNRLVDHEGLDPYVASRKVATEVIGGLIGAAVGGAIGEMSILGPIGAAIGSAAGGLAGSGVASWVYENFIQPNVHLPGVSYPAGNPNSPAGTLASGENTGQIVTAWQPVSVAGPYRVRLRN